MRSLFFKIFALLMGSAIVLACIVFSLFHLASRGDRAYGYVYELAEEAAERYEDKGERALQRKLDRVFRRYGVRGFLLHENGEAIGKRPPKFLRDNITRYPQTVRDLETPRGRVNLRSVSVTSDENNDYRFVAFIRGRDERYWILQHPTARFILPLLIFALASFLISLLITRPLAGLRQATQKFALGDLSARAPEKIVKRSDAFGELAREFDQMGSRVEKLVGEHKRLLRDVSHELRSPLSRMQVAATLLEDKLEDDTLPRNQIERIQSEIVRLDNMIAQLLSLTRLQAGATDLGKSEFELKALLETIAQDAAYEFADQNKHITVSGSTITINADVEKLRSAFENIIRNGLRYAKSKLEINVSQDGSLARVQISDDGAGVEESSLENIFKPFYRPDESRTESTGNFGIGLAIAKSVIVAHRGAISAANQDRGGLVVTVQLPNA